MTQRVIKFRAWHNEAKAMLQVGDNHGTTHPLDCALYARHGQDVVLMLWTGLLDKHGKEIYEHDILKVDDDYDKYGWAAGMIGRVIFDKGKYMLSDGTSRFFFEDNQMSYVERLGDLYTTPELVDPKMIER